MFSVAVEYGIVEEWQALEDVVHYGKASDLTEHITTVGRIFHGNWIIEGFIRLNEAHRH